MCVSVFAAHAPVSFPGTVPSGDLDSREGEGSPLSLRLLREQPIRLALLLELRFEEEFQRFEADLERFEAQVEPLHSEVGDASRECAPSEDKEGKGDGHGGE